MCLAAASPGESRTRQVWELNVPRSLRDCTRNAAFCGVRGCGVRAEEGQREVRGVRKPPVESQGIGHPPRKGWSTNPPVLHNGRVTGTILGQDPSPNHAQGADVPKMGVRSPRAGETLSILRYPSGDSSLNRTQNQAGIAEQISNICFFWGPFCVVQGDQKAEP